MMLSRGFQPKRSFTSGSILGKGETTDEYHGKVPMTYLLIPSTKYFDLNAASRGFSLSSAATEKHYKVSHESHESFESLELRSIYWIYCKYPMALDC